MTNDDILNLFLRKTGQPIEAGWKTYREMVVPPDLDEREVEKHRMTFYSGCAHLMAALSRSVGKGATEAEIAADQDRTYEVLSDIRDELRVFFAEMGVKHARRKR